MSGPRSPCWSAVPACRHADGTISSSGVPDVRRMASEDSDQVVPGLSAVHGLRNLRDLDQSTGGQMIASGDHVHAPCELLKIEPLRAAERIPLEERNDRFQQIHSPVDAVLMEMLLVVVVASVDKEPSHSEE